MNKVEKSNTVVSNDTISKPLEISRHGDPHIVETLEEAAGNYPSIIRTISPQWESEIEMAFKAGAQWRKEQMIDMACEWLEEHLLDFWTQKITNIDYFIEEFKKAIEE